MSAFPSRLHLRLTVDGVRPRIWREIEADEDLSVHDLHRCVQLMMGWRDTAPHELRTTTTPALRWGRATPETPDLLDEDTATLGEAAAHGDLSYRYGADWSVRVQALAHTGPIPAGARILLLDGERRGPWEDAGGPQGYAERVALFGDRRRPEYLALSEWLDRSEGPWSPVLPSYFDATGVQSELNLLFDPVGAGLDLDDLSGLVRRPGYGSEDGPQPTSALVRFVSELSAPLRGQLRMHLHRTGALARMNEWTDADQAASARAVAPFVALLSALGPDGAGLTRAGWLPSAVVEQVLGCSDWAAGWDGPRGSEASCAPVRSVREQATRVGLVRKVHGRLVPTAAALRAVVDPHLLLRQIGVHVLDRLRIPARVAGAAYLLACADGTPRALRWRASRFALDSTGLSAPVGGALSAPDLSEVAPPGSAADAATGRGPGQTLGEREIRDIIAPVWDTLRIAGGWSPAAERDSDVAALAREALR